MDIKLYHIAIISMIYSNTCICTKKSVEQFHADAHSDSLHLYPFILSLSLSLILF